MNEKYNELLGLVPGFTEQSVDWSRVMRSGLASYLDKMSLIPQNPCWHGEGDVLAHTKMVCESLIKLEEWRGLERQKQEELFIAALLHDLGKTVCTRIEDGLPISPNHTSVGDRMARTVLWRDFGLCGTRDLQRFRETICTLIRNHSIPFHFYDESFPDYKTIRISSEGELVSHFSNELLYILVKADILGRISDDTAERLDHIEYFKESAKEALCLKQPKLFPSPFSRYAYLSGRDIFPGQALYDDTWGTVIMISGLPGTGKDTYIKMNYPNMPVVSLDALREELKVAPTEPQGRIVAAAREQAKGYLRNKQPFIWNATDLTRPIRSRQVEMFTNYKALVKIIFLETRWNEMLNRNLNRKDSVPNAVIGRMLEKTTPPNLCEAHDVEWILV